MDGPMTKQTHRDAWWHGPLERYLGRCLHLWVYARLLHLRLHHFSLWFLAVSMDFAFLWNAITVFP